MNRSQVIARSISALFALAVLGACGGDDADGPVTSEPAATTTESPTTESPTTESPTTEPPTTEPASTTEVSAPTTDDAPTTTSRTRLWAEVEPPAVNPQGGGSTDPIDPAWLEESGETLGTDVADGVYWAKLVGPLEGVGGRGLSLDFSQAFFGEACYEQFGSGDDACMNDYDVLSDPHGEFPAWIDQLQYVTVTNLPGVSYLIDGEELFALASGEPPSAGAPDGWVLTALPYLATVSGGAVVSLDQVWLP